MSLNQWTYVVATFDGGTLTLYVDAVEQDSSTTPIVIPATSKPFAVGARNGGTWLWFNGSIDEVAIYDRALDRTQLEAHRRLALGE